MMMLKVLNIFIQGKAQALPLGRFTVSFRGACNGLAVAVVAHQDKPVGAGKHIIADGFNALQPLIIDAHKAQHMAYLCTG